MGGGVDIGVHIRKSPINRLLKLIELIYIIPTYLSKGEF